MGKSAINMAICYFRDVPVYQRGYVSPLKKQVSHQGFSIAMLDYQKVAMICRFEFPIELPVGYATFIAIK